MRAFLIPLLPILALGAGCTTSPPGDLDDPKSERRDQARAMGGKSDQAEDLCALEGLYADGTCDDFCVAPDPDCECGGGAAGAGCTEDQVCLWPEPSAPRCGEGDQSGVCRQRPTICTRDVAPACGCDGTTYMNPCFAHAAGVDVRSAGPCASVGQCGSGERECPGCPGAGPICVPEVDTCPPPLACTPGR